MGSLRQVVLMAAALWLTLTLSGCSARFDYAQGKAMTGGDPEAGKLAIVHHDCHSCHIIPGIEGDRQTQGPELDHWAKRSKIIERWPNQPANLENWIRNSEKLKPDTAMKMMSVSERDAKDIAAYLYSIQ